MATAGPREARRASIAVSFGPYPTPRAFRLYSFHRAVWHEFLKQQLSLPSVGRRFGMNQSLHTEQTAISSAPAIAVINLSASTPNKFGIACASIDNPQFPRPTSHANPGRT